MRSSVRDLLFVTLNLAVFASFGWLLYADFSARIEQSGGVRLGTITYKKNVAERKYGDQVIWEPIPDKAILYDNDTLRTAGNSEAVVELDDGTRIELAEETLIMLARSGRGLAIDFRQGSISAKGAVATGTDPGGATNIQIKSGNTAVALNRADASFRKKAGDEFTVDVARGQATVEQGGRQTAVRENERATMVGDATGPEIRKAGIALVPGPGIVLTADAMVVVAFAWTADGVPRETLEVARDAGFAAPEIVRAGTTRGASATLAPGTWYWRVRGAGGEMSRSERITVIRAVAPEPLAPASGSVRLFHKVQPLVNLQWASDGSASGYDIEIARDPAFATIALRLTSRGGQIATDLLGPGEYWWRVRARFTAARGASVTGSTARFAIVRRETPPSVGVPAGAASVTTVQLQSRQAAIAWQGDPEFAKYKVEISSTPDFATVVYREETPGNVSRMKSDLPAGQYYWRVTGIDADGRAAAPSVAVVLDVKKPQPAWPILPLADAMLFADNGTVPVLFSWNDPNRSGRVLLEIAADDSFARPLESRIQGGTAATVALPPGNYVWRLTVLDAARTAVAVSPARRFAVLRPLATPVLVSPATGSELDMAKINAIDFSWRPVAGATAYEFTLSMYAGAVPRKIFSLEVADSEYRFAQLDRLDRGGFVWEIRAIDRDAGGRIRTASPAARADFRIKLRELKKTVILSPQVIYVD